MSTWEDVQEDVYDWVVSSSGLEEEQVIFDKQNAPKPNLTLITINESLAFRKKGQACREHQIDGKLRIIQAWEADMSINCYGSDALDRMINILSSLDEPGVRDAFHQNGISVSTDNDEIRDLSMVEGKEWVNRRQLDITVRFSIEKLLEPGYFETVELSYDEMTNPDDFELILSKPIESTLEKPESLNFNTHEIIETITTREIIDTGERDGSAIVTVEVILP